MKTLAVAEMMTTNPITCGVESTIVEVSQLLKKYNISSIVIVEDDEVKGLITVDDIVRRVVANNENTEVTKAKQIMTTDIVGVEPNKPLEEVIDIMNSNSVSQVPVMEGRKLVGFVTMKDILRLEPAFFEMFSGRIAEQEQERKAFIHKYSGVSEEDLD